MPTDRIQLAKEWWAQNVNDRPVWRSEDLPDVSFKGILIAFELAFEIRRDTLVLAKPGTDLTTLIRSYFWEIASCILKPYSPYAITGITALNWYLGYESIPKEVSALTKSSSNRIDLHGMSELIIEKRSDFFKPEKVETYIKAVTTSRNYPLRIEAPESLLTRLRPQYLRDYPQIVSAFLKGVDFDLRTLRELLLQESRPIVYRRVAELLEQIGKKTESELIRSMVKITSQYSLPGRAQIIKHPLPAMLATSPRLSDPVYVTRFRDQLRSYRHQLNTDLKNLKLPQWELKQVLAYGKQTKKYDTYHSSTIEGFRVSQEEIDVLIKGQIVSLTNASQEEIERKMALKGYLEAHKFLLQTIEENFRKSTPLTELVIREIYAHLFSPSVEAGLLTKEKLIQYRSEAVYIRNSRYVPPNHQKVDDLMRCMVEELNGIENQAIRAILAHYAFVTIHPYFDGNGRVARLLMNLILGMAGIPWITIRIEDRETYFRALEKAQCDEDISAFNTLMIRYLEESKTFKID